VPPRSGSWWTSPWWTSPWWTSPSRVPEAESENLAEVVREVNGAGDVGREQMTWTGPGAWVGRWQGPATTGSDAIVGSHSLDADPGVGPQLLRAAL